MAAVVVVIALAVAVPEAQAIPVWSRKYKTSCATCHEVYPRLNAVGESFRLNGYKFSDEETLRKEDPVVMGQEAYKKVWPDSIWPSDIPGLPPFALRVISDYNMDIGGTKDARSQFEYPHEIELFTAGSMGDQISFLVELEFENEDDEWGTAAAGWIQFEDIVGSPNVFNARIGSMGMQEFGLLTARDHNRFTKEHYLYVNSRLPYPGGFDTKNTYRGRDEQPGIEINGFGDRWRYAVGVVNGGGNEDSNSEKDFYLQLTYKLTGLGFDGSGGEKSKELGASGKGIWRDDSVILGLFGYRGTAVVNATGDDADMEEDNFWRFGPGIQWKYQDFTGNIGMMWGDNDDPYGTLSDDSVDSMSWFVEGSYFIYPWLVPTLRHETVSYDLPNDLAGLQEEQDKSQLVASVKALIRANVSLTLEGRFATKHEKYTKDDDDATEKNDDDLVSVRLDFAF
ncbi:MAG: hypothetical protein A2Z34_03535 [Planctomycetes bacterium RBG_16_59_8]|nr:MAG: hypothetical protein A2Z34_03535 [Planctomycetes bacterium RBG_16_59_8]